jgi:iron complex outermembrane receptor protein
VANVAEIGPRPQSGSRLSYSATLFHHAWDRLRSGTTLPLIIENRIEGPVYGFEAWGTWQITDRWRLSSGITRLRQRLRLQPGSTDPLGPRNVTLANDPSYQWSMRSSWDLGDEHELDASLRHIADLETAPVPAYTAVDLRYGWRIRPTLQLSVSVQNLFDQRHPEFRTGAQLPIEIERSLLISWRWEPAP